MPCPMLKLPALFSCWRAPRLAAGAAGNAVTVLCSCPLGLPASRGVSCGLSCMRAELAACTEYSVGVGAAGKRQPTNETRLGTWQRLTNEKATGQKKGPRPPNRAAGMVAAAHWSVLVDANACAPQPSSLERTPLGARSVRTNTTGQSHQARQGVRCQNTACLLATCAGDFQALWGWNQAAN